MPEADDKRGPGVVQRVNFCRRHVFPSAPWLPYQAHVLRRQPACAAAHDLAFVDFAFCIFQRRHGRSIPFGWRGHVCRVGRELKRIKFFIRAALGEQCVVRTLFNDTPVLNHINHIGIDDGR